MEKTLATLIDELSITNIKIYHLVDKVQKDEHTREEAKKIQDLNTYRVQLCNAISEKMNEIQQIKVDGEKK